MTNKDFEKSIAEFERIRIGFFMPTGGIGEAVLIDHYGLEKVTSLTIPSDSSELARILDAMQAFFLLLEYTTNGRVLMTRSGLYCEERDREAIEAALALYYLAV